MTQRKKQVTFSKVTMFVDPDEFAAQCSDGDGVTAKKKRKKNKKKRTKS